MKKIITLFFLFACASLGYANILGLSVAPINMVFTPRQTIQTFTVSNRSANTLAYRLSLSDEVMNADGSLSPQADGFAYSAKKMIRFSPNEITLAPGEHQIVRVMIRRPADLADGDYHSHVMFEEQLTKTQTDLKLDETQGAVLKTELKALLTLGVPVVIQHGKIEQKLEMVGLVDTPKKLEDGQYSPFEVSFKRSGNATGVGFLTLKDPKGQDIMAPRSVSVYRERDEVTMKSQATEYGLGYKGPAILTLHAGNTAQTPIAKQIDVQIP
jgi:hypothetical protein